MKINILSKKTRRGKKDFKLDAKEGEAFRIEAFRRKDNAYLKFEGMISIVWGFEGELVHLLFPDKYEQASFYGFDEVTIKSMPRLSKEVPVEADKSINLSVKDWGVLRNGLVAAMKQADENGDKKFADALEKVDNKISEQML